MLGTVLLIVLLVHQKSKGGGGGGSVIAYDKKGLMWSVCAGLAVGTAEMLSFCVSGMGVPATHFIPISTYIHLSCFCRMSTVLSAGSSIGFAFMKVIGGSVCIGAVLGLVLLGEKMMIHGWSGIFMLCIGISMVATDPGDKVEEVPAGGDGAVKVAPPVIIWIGPALICASAYGAFADDHGYFALSKCSWCFV